MSHSTTDASATCWPQVGLSYLSVEETVVTFDGRSTGDVTAYLQATAPHLASMVATLPPHEQADVWTEIVEAVGQRSEAFGAVRPLDLVLLAVG